MPKKNEFKTAPLNKAAETLSAGNPEVARTSMPNPPTTKSAPANRPAPTQAPRQPNKRTFTFRAPAAASVMLVGDFTHWQQQPIALKSQGGGLWRAEVSLPPGPHHYRFLVDGEWRDDPECFVRVPNEFGSENCVCQA